MEDTTIKLVYRDKIILAPMVRVGTLPMRLLALRYGADIVYSEELIDHKLLACERVINDVLGTVDYTWSDGDVLFRTCPEERHKVVLQIGTCDAQRALNVGKMFENDIAGIDLNMGCPKEFSIKGGMGAALLTQPEKVHCILTTLVEGLSIPVTCKIRILPDLEKTLELAKAIEKTGVKAIGVHGRFKEERSSMPCHKDVIRKISEHLSIPVIANGGSLDMTTFKDFEKFKDETGSSSVMIARAAQWNPSIFRKDGILDKSIVMVDYLKIAVNYDNNFPNTKYVLCKMMQDVCGTEQGRALAASKDMEELCAAFKMSEYLKNAQESVEKKRKLIDGEPQSSEPYCKRTKLTSLIEMNVSFKKNHYPHTISPLQTFYHYVRTESLVTPSFLTLKNEKDKLFKSVLTMDGTKYTSKLSFKRKKVAEQSAALCFLTYHGIDDGRIK